MTFPAIEALSRSYSLPRRPASSVAQRSGSRQEFSHDPAGLTSPVTFEIPEVREADLDAVLAHYRAMKGHGRFSIPEQMWQNHAALDDLVPFWDRGSPVFWRYAGPPEWRMGSGGLYSIAVSLVTGF
jgi:hypothetical protein